MLFISVDDFFQKARSVKRLSRSDEKIFALEMKEGKADARQAIVNSYLPFVASYIGRLPKELQTLEMIYSCVCSLEKGVDSFEFLQDSKTFANRLIWCFRQCITRCLANRY